MHKVITYFEIGKLLNEAGGQYGDNIIDEYSKKLVLEVGKKYNRRTLFRMKQFYNIFSNEKVSQLATQLSWSHYIEMKELFFRMNNTRKIAIEYGLKKFDRFKIKEYETVYDNILKKAIKENKHIGSSFYKLKANKLYNRFKKYKKNHFYFIKDFIVSFDNNLSEQDLRMFKNNRWI